jgi:hypothetical protein
MDLLDVNVLVNAYRRDASHHQAFKAFVESLCHGEEPFAVPSAVWAGFLRVVTHQRVFSPPSAIEDALVFADQVLSQRNCLTLEPGRRHWEIFLRLCKAGGARGNLVSDAYLAAIAIEQGSELVTADRGFGRWPGLRWRHPFDP